MEQQRNNWKLPKVENARVCPHCGHKISMRRCLPYILFGTNHTTICNYCQRKVSLKREPLPFNLCVYVGLLSSIIPLYFLLYVIHYEFVESVLTLLPFWILEFIVMSIATIRRIEFE